MLHRGVLSATCANTVIIRSSKSCTVHSFILSALPLYISFLSAQWGGHWRTVWQQRRQALLACPAVQRCRCELDIKTSGLEALSLPLWSSTQQPTPLWLGTNPPPPQSFDELTSCLHVWFTSAWHKCFLKRVDKRLHKTLSMNWRVERAKTERCVQTTKLCYCWININHLHSQGLTTIILRTWHCIQTPAQKCEVSLRLGASKELCTLQPLWPWLNPKGKKCGTDT